MSLLLCGCDEKERGIYVTHLPAQLEKDGNWSFVDRKGKIILENAFLNRPSPIIDGFFIEKSSDGLYNLCTLNEDGSYFEVDFSDNCASVGIIQNGLIPLCFVGEHITVFDKNGNKKFVLNEIDGVEVKSCDFFSDGFLKVTLVDNTVAYVDKFGDKTHSQRYIDGSHFVNGYALVLSQHNNKSNDALNDSCVADTSQYNRISVIDANGDSQYTLEKEETLELFDPYNCKLAVKKGEDTYIVDWLTREENKVPVKVNEILGLYDDYYIYQNTDSKCGAFTYENEIVLRPKYKYLCKLGNKLLAKHKDVSDEIRLIDQEDNLLKTYTGWSFEDMFYNNLINFPVIIKSNESDYLINNRGFDLCKKSINNIYSDYFNDDDFKVENHFVPKDSISDFLLSFCFGNNQYGLCIYKDNGQICKAHDVSFIKENPSQFSWKSNAYLKLQEGQNYEMGLYAYFDSNISHYENINKYSYITRFCGYVEFKKEHIARKIANKINASMERKMILDKEKDNEYYLYEDKDGKTIILVIVEDKSIYVNIAKASYKEGWRKFIDEHK